MRLRILTVGENKVPYLLAGEADYLLKVAVSDTADYERFHRQYLSRFPGVAHLHSNFAIRTVCSKTELEV